MADWALGGSAVEGAAGAAMVEAVMFVTPGIWII
jgi:hypothetical protein